MTSSEEALTVRCPTCHAKKGQPCTYVVVVPYGHTQFSPATLARVALTGTPTKMPHNERRAARQRVERRARLPLVAGPSPEILAVKEFDRLEFVAMRAWLTANVRIFL